MRLTTGDICEVTDFSRFSLDDWCRRGLITPAAGGAGSGSQRQFTLMQAVGLAVALKLYHSARSCAPGYVGRIIAAFAELTEEQLAKRLKAGETHLVGIHSSDDGTPLLLLDTQRYPDQIDVAAVFEEVTAKVAEIQAQLAHLVPGGRLRGLAGSARKTLTDKAAR